jgi:hypothetical protein
MDGGTKEIMILNPQIIRGFTADPDILRIELNRELKNLRDPKFEYSDTEIHFDKFRANATDRRHFRDYAIGIIKDLIENGRKYIPSFFLRDLSG